MPSKQQNQAAPVERAEEHVAKAEGHVEEAQAELVAAHQERVEAAQAQAERSQGAVVEQQIEELRQAVAANPARLGYTVGLWAGRVHYVANDGGFDTFDEAEMQAYIRSAVR